MRRPRRPSSSMSSPGRQLEGDGVDEDRAGVLAAGLVLAPPPHDLGQLGLGPRRGRRARAEPRRTRPLGGRRGRSRGSEGRARSAAPHNPPRCEVEHADPHQRGGDVRAVAAGVHAHAAPDRPRHAHRPLEPGEAGGHRLAGEHGQAAQPRPPSHVVPSTVELVRPHGAEHEASPSKPAVGDEQVGAPPDDEHRQPGRAGTAAADGGEVVGDRRPRAAARPAPPTR